ncbi:MAG: hypothetical protein A2015_17340 [Spirochaetes bacterium GWF1_31_7]|nr:MAG: hypothetical protein A2Y30_14580 [Spirochaetes bacterium GWE1_32_154]OHD46862.1 MAG: hypothetical protein A2015_17340 [Spirochaetes bacterium GWF1_31_7]OHD50181.1 MAG: hypothetical protein A2Y29_12625 [Spirochaetes bacterium GWE2_31_10]OHD81974.1 MAG: hypothetical protein A2355_02045 [Spirochaetes bacterium RIFOXYB1_FULL_32_8]HBD94040.1 hypothetical protein [Spirochaetia bacterium]
MQKHLDWSIKNSIRIVLITLVAFFLMTLLNMIFPVFFQFWDNRINDQIYNFKQTIKGNSTINPYIIHLDLNDTSISKNTISMFDRSVYADSIAILHRLKAKSIVLDINYQEKFDADIDGKLAQSGKNHGKTYFPVIPQSVEFSGTNKIAPLDPELEKIIDEQLALWQPVVKREGNPIVSHRIITNFPELQKASHGIVHIAVESDNDGIYRRIPLLIQYKNKYIPFIELKVICDYLKVKDSDVEVYFGQYIILKNATFQFGIKKDIKIPIDLKGRMIIHYAGRWADSFAHYSIETILELKNDTQKLEELKDEFKDSIVIISDITTRGKDYGNIPIENKFPLPGIHSNFLNSVLQMEFIKKFSVFEKVILNLSIILILSFFGIRYKTIKFSIFATTFFILFQFFNSALFVFFNRQPDILVSNISFLLSAFSIIIYRYIIEERSNLQYIISLHAAASKFVPTEFLQFLNKLNILEVKLGDQIQTEMTVLFSDIRSFTNISEIMLPAENFNFLNSYLSKMGPVIRENGGFIDKYIGDAIMALFPDDPGNCVQAAIDLRLKLTEFNTERRIKGEIEIDTGIGIHTGNLMLGIIGEDKRYEGTVIADAVNLASRLEGLTKYYGAGIIISEVVYKRLKDPSLYAIRILDYVLVKGKKESIAIYEVIDNSPDRCTVLKVETKLLFEKAFYLYTNKKFSEALEIYNEINQLNPDDKATIIFIERCKHHIQSGVDDNWIGIAVHLEK